MVESVKMEGFEAVRKALIETPKHLRKKVMHTILRKAALPILRAAKANAPRATRATKRVIPGLLKKTLGITRSKIKKASRGEFGVFITARKPGQVKRLGRLARKSGAKGPNFGDPFYHRFQEGGFHAVGSRRVKGGKRNRAANLKSSGSRFIPGKKYLGGAFESQKQNAVNIIKADLVKETVAAFERRAKNNG